MNKELQEMINEIDFKLDSIKTTVEKLNQELLLIADEKEDK